MSALQGRRPVLVGVDGSEPALRAVRWAALEARRLQVPLRVVTASGDRGIRHLTRLDLGPDYREAVLEVARAQVAAATDVARKAAPGVEVTSDVLAADPVPALLEESRQARLVVLGNRGLGGFSGLLAGSVTVAVTAHATCPVVVVRGAEQDPGVAENGPVVVGVDGSPLSDAALAFAFADAEAHGSALVAVHAWQDMVVDPNVGAYLDWEAIEREENRLLAEQLAGVAQKYPDVPVDRVVVVRESPARLLVELSAGARLVVVGARGRGGFTGLLLGSTSQALVHHAQCPVAVVRPDQPEHP
ncbi:universal stress protein [Pseudonocardia acidicola]|uniref:Universal stress protein n=1 Tax=Pseudonocardia acidicola TaxID=2724939 RepID=A0ABX1SA41_9PSEU|nr:universal stress protein [Pseudonocardia acidicola]NMH97784.1 universal stress protein [Pseudonocardia acidicola]